MVQLKSFRYLSAEEDSTEPDNSESAAQQPEVQQATSRDSSSSSATSSSIGSSMSGLGNVTGVFEDDQQQSDQEKQDNKPEESTLSSNEEYQIANHDVIEEEDETSYDEQEAVDKVLEVGKTQQQQQQQPIYSKHQQNKISDRIPPSPLTNRIRSPSRQILTHSMSTGNIGKLNQQQQQQNQQLDSVSQCSFVQRQSNGNQFEIRWHTINLFAAKKIHISEYFTDTWLFKKFKSTTEQTIEKPLKLNQIISGIEKPVRSASLTTEDEFPTMDTAQQQRGRQILKNVSGSVQSGQLTAILGPSGVGKTSLLSTLTGRNTLDGTGKVLLFGGEKATKRMSVVTVPQEDVLPNKLTCLEDLQFTSRIKNPQRGFDHLKNVKKIVQTLNMEKFLNTKIEKLSGGEARRLSIGRELLSSPDIMILDEPTSGLDANTCKKIISALRDIVVHSDTILDKPMSIVVTIHQPQQEVLNLFHKIYIMAQGGRAIYEGSPSLLLPTLLCQSSISKNTPIDQLNENPAIVGIEVASGEFGQEVIEELALHHENQMYEDYAYSVSNFNLSMDDFGTPYSTPRIPPAGRTPKTPVSVTPRFGHRPRLKSLGRDSLGGGRQTPVLSMKALRHQQLQQADKLSAITSVSFASTYDYDLPEEVSTNLKVDKRLRRSVVMKNHFFKHTLVLMQRCWLLATRDKFLMCIRILGFFLVAAGIVQIFGPALSAVENQCPLYQTEVDDVRGFFARTRDRLMNMSWQLKQASSTHLFFFHLILCVTVVMSALTGLVFPMQMRMFMREYKNGWYSPGSFVTSITLAELPIDIIGPTLTVLITYPMCNQPESGYYWREIGYILIMCLGSIICKSQAQIVGAFLMDSVENSVFISCVSVMPAALLSGIAVRASNMYLPLQYLTYGSFLKYTFESLLVLRYGYGICPCDPETVFGYPSVTSLEAMPAQLERMANNFIELNSASTQPETTNSTNLTVIDAATAAAAGTNDTQQQPSAASNLFNSFLQLVSASSNQFVPKLEDLGDCNSYRSLYLIDMGVEDYNLHNWMIIFVGMFIISRIITYFVVRAVIKLRSKRSH